jgi:micrococcal nuclease
MNKKISSVVIVIVLLAIVNTSFAIELDKAVVQKVIDGDTIELSDGEQVRLIGLDTPELNPPHGPIEYYGLQAKKYSKNKLLGATVYLEYGREKHDQYERSLAYLYLDDGTMFNKKLLATGHAYLLTIEPNTKYREKFKELVIESRQNKRGLWQQQYSDDLPVISWQEAADYTGEEVVVEGQVDNTYDSGEVIFLNFAQNYQETFTAVIFAKDQNKFAINPSSYFLHREVKIRGRIEEYQGVPELVISQPDQIQKLD